MTTGGIEKFLKEEKCSFREAKVTPEDFKDISAVFSEEPFPIFEQSPQHILSYLKYDYRPIYTEAGCFRGVLLVAEKDAVIFSPFISNFESFLGFVSRLKDFFSVGEIKIQNVSGDWLEKRKKDLSGIKHRIELRSKEEVVYDVPTVSHLQGSGFANLRNAEKRLIQSGELNFKDVEEKNLGDVLKVLEVWNETQGSKYEKKKKEKEKFTLEAFLGFKKILGNRDLLFEAGYLNGNPVSISLMHRSPLKRDWGIIYSVKGINKPENKGAHGVSDATYIRCFKTASEWGLNFLNDGELGSEPGTRNHKLAFKPTMYLKSFDVFI